MKNLLLILLILGFGYAAIAQNEVEEEHPIDIKLDQCLDIDTNQTTYGTIACFETSREDWDIELNKYYQLLMDVIQEDAKAMLKESQLKWIEYRDLEYAFSNKMHTDMEGTLWKIVAAGRRYEIVKARALELKSYYETYTFD